ncbi:NUDIX domain-containing protein [Heyndrickxia sporothermodurans]|uniref:NUDIX hydrolase n=1 Tax=Heyndrickxia TaxID=2837504 RepID=UPI0030FB8606
MNSKYVNWDGQNIKLTWLKNYEPPINLVTSVHGWCFLEGKVLLVLIKNRGFNMPGGHVEHGETPKQTFCREAFEEGYVKGTIHYLGALEINHHDNPLFDPNGKYPSVGYQLFYRMDITECLPFLRQHESVTRIWVEPDQVPYIMEDHELALQILSDALKVVVQ